MSSGSNYKTLAMLPLFEYQVFGPIEAKYNSMANCRCVGDKLGFDRRRLHFETGKDIESYMFSQSPPLH